MNKLDTVFPNVTVGGIDLSGLTLDEAKKALSDAGYEDNASNVGITVNFPDGEKMTITGEESGMSLRADDAAQAAYNYGKDGSFFTNEMNYVKSLFTMLELEDSGITKINEDYVRGVVNDYTQKFNDKMMNGALKINDDNITVIKGSGTALADANAIYDIVVTSLNKSAEQNSPVTVDYTVGGSGGDDIDLQSIYNSIYKEPVDSIYDTTTNQVTQSVTGISFDVNAAQKALDDAQTGAMVTIPLVKTEPTVTTEQLQSLIFRDILSEKSTYVAGTSNRVHNVKLAAEAMNGTVLNPGEVFSYNETLGQRTKERGYAEAGAYVGGKVVQEIGGGICQGSSTLYYCVLYADLEVVERQNHMFIVTYLPLGNDATVNWGTIDFKFKNNTDYPIKIEALMKDGYLSVKLHGTKVNDIKIDVEEVVISKTDFKTIQKEDPSVAPGTTKADADGHTGYVVDTYKCVYDGAGNLLSKTFLERNKYKVQDKVILVPVGTLTTPSPTDGTSPSPSASPSDSSPSTSETTPTV